MSNWDFLWDRRKTRTYEILKKLFSCLSETVEWERETNSETTQPNQLHLVTPAGTQFSHSDLIKCIGELQETLFDFFVFLSLSSFPSCLILTNPSLQKYTTVFPLIYHNQPIFSSPTLCWCNCVQFLYFKHFCSSEVGIVRNQGWFCDNLIFLHWLQCQFTTTCSLWFSLYHTLCFFKFLALFVFF